MKKQLSSYIAALIFLISSPLLAQNLQWQPTNGPWGGPVSGFVANDSVILAGASTGTYRSTNNGDSWQWVFEPIGPFAIADSAIFAVANNEGIYRSKDNGATWQRVVKGYFTSVAANRQTVIALGQPVFRSRNGGETWDTLPNGAFSNLYPQTMVVTETSLIVGTCSGIYRSTDTGNSWTEIAGITKDSGIQIMVQSSTAIFAAGGANAQSNGAFSLYIFRSTDDGLTWTYANSYNSDPAITSLVADDSAIYVIDGWGALFKSNDKAKSWTEIPTQGNYGNNEAILGRGQKLFLATQSGGAVRSTDGGATWSMSNIGIYAYDDQSMVSTGDRILVGTGWSGAYSSQDSGASWIPHDSGIGDSYISQLSIDLIASSNSGLYLAAQGGLGSNIFRSTDDGESWSVTAADFGSLPQVLCLSAVADTIFAGSYGGAMYSTDDGKTWSNCSSLPENFSIFYGIREAPGVVYANGKRGLYRSFDLGGSWSKIDTGTMAGATVNYAEGSVVFATINWSQIRGTLFRSTDYGSSWHLFGTIPSGITSLAVAGNIFVAITQSGIYCLSDDGVTWNAQNDGLSDSLNIYQVVSMGSKIYACTSYRGVFVADLPPTSIVENAATSHGADFEIFPNPLSASSTISYSLLQSGQISITILDPLGRTVSNPITEEFQEAGPHEIPIDARGLAPGIYLCRVSGEGIEEETKFVVER